MIKRLFIILLIAATCNAQVLHDRDIYDIEHRKYHRSVVDIMISTGTAEGQLLYWDTILFGIDRWRNSDVTKLKWNDATNTLLVDTLNLNNPLDISTYTNLVAGTNITLVGDTLNVDDAFLVNDGDDTTTGTITAGGFTTAGTVDTGILIVDTDTLVANATGYADRVGIGTVTPGNPVPTLLHLKGTDSSMLGPHMIFETAADTYPIMQIMPWAHDSGAIAFDAYYDGLSHKSSDAGSNARIHKKNDLLSFRYDSGIAQGNNITWNDALVIDLIDGAVTTDIFIVGSNAPATSTSAGVAGTITYDANWLYIAIANNSWKRSALSTWVIAAENVIYAAENVIYAAEQVVYP